MPADTGFSLGFFCGMMLGAVGVYIVTTPEGRNFKNTVIEDFKKHHQTLTLESLMPSDDKVHPLTSNLHNLIARARTYFNQPQVPKLKEHNKVVILKKKHIFKKK